MNTRDPIDTSSGPAAHSVAFNKDNSCFVVALSDGFRAYKSEECELNCSTELPGRLSSGQMLDNTQYLALVPYTTQHELHIWNDKRERIAFRLSFDSPVLKALVCKEYIIAVLETSVHLYAMHSPPQFLSKYETVSNPYGICVLSSTSFAFPGRTKGHVILVNLATRKIDTIITAHSGPLRAITISPDGEYLATASDKGTIIRLWSPHTGARIAEFRRGIEPADIFSLSFSKTSQFLASTSDKGTLHIYEMPGTGDAIDENDTATEVGSTRASTRTRSPHGSFSNSMNSSYETLPTINTAYAPSTSMGSAASGERKNKWHNFMSKVPGAPRIFKDVYSACSCPFSIGDESPLRSAPAAKEKESEKSPADSTSTIKVSAMQHLKKGVSRPPKGVIGWLSDDTLIVVGAGEDARWEKFVLGWDEGGTRVVRREGWKRFFDVGKPDMREAMNIASDEEEEDDDDDDDDDSNWKEDGGLPFDAEVASDGEVEGWESVGQREIEVLAKLAKFGF